MPVRAPKLVVGPLRISVLHGKQKGFSNDAKIDCSWQLKIAIPRISMLLRGCGICCDEKCTRRPVTEKNVFFLAALETTYASWSYCHHSSNCMLWCGTIACLLKTEACSWVSYHSKGTVLPASSYTSTPAQLLWWTLSRLMTLFNGWLISNYEYQTSDLSCHSILAFEHLNAFIADIKSRCGLI